MTQKKDEDGKPPKAPEKKDSETSNDRSMINRVQSSASGLLRNAVAGTGANDLNADLSNSLSSTGKASSSQGSRTAGSSLSATESSRLSSNAPGATGAGEHRLQSDSFRSGLASQEDGFELGETNGNDLLYDLSDTKGKGTGTGTTSGEEPLSQQQSLTTNDLSTFNTAWNTQQPQDGSDVVALLSNPSFQPDNPDPEPAAPEPSEDQEIELSPSEIDLINSFRRHPSMPPSSTLHSPPPLNPLSLIPDLSSQPESQQSEESHLRTLPGISEWVDLDQTYHAEVWGYLRPHIRAAMDEIEERRKEGGAGGEGGTKDGPAVRRLQMILRHMRGA